ncbi:MAG: hypothetical protein ACKPKO_31360, partial [Candidatus Fonsibacter sp.]
MLVEEGLGHVVADEELAYAEDDPKHELLEDTLRIGLEVLVGLLEGLHELLAQLQVCEDGL